MSDWTGLNFGAAWPFLATSYGLFFALLGFGAASLRWQRRKLRQQRLILAALEAHRASVCQVADPENDNRKTPKTQDPQLAHPAKVAHPGQVDAGLRAQDP